jgi:hypothetical protein
VPATMPMTASVGGENNSIDMTLLMTYIKHHI